MILFQELGQCEGVVLGAGRGTCPIGDLGDLLGLGLNAKGTILATTAGGYTESVFRDLITNGKKHQLLNIDSFEDATPENERYTSPQGFMKSVREGKPMYNINFRNGYCFDKALQSMKGQDRWDVELYFSTGVLFTTNSAGTQLKGFNLGMFDANVFKFLSGTDTEFSRISLQFKDASEFTDKWVFIPYSVLGYNPLEIDDVIQTNVTFDLQPSSTDAVIVVKPTDSCNNSISYASLFDAVGNWLVLVNGVNVIISSVSSSADGTVNIGIPALSLGQEVRVSLNGIVSDTEMKYYKSNVATATVTS
jgi:hypothetical protein